MMRLKSDKSSHYSIMSPSEFHVAGKMHEYICLKLELSRISRFTLILITYETSGNGTVRWQSRDPMKDEIRVWDQTDGFQLDAIC